MGQQTKATRQSDYVAPPTISGANRVGNIAATNVASAADLHSGRADGVDLPAGKYVTFQNIGLVDCYLVLDSESGGTAATAANSVPVPIGAQVSYLLADGVRDPATTLVSYAHRYAKVITSGGATTLAWWISTQYGVE